MDDNKAIRIGIVLGLIALFSFGAYVVMKSFKSPDPVALNNDPVDFSGPPTKGVKGKRTPASAGTPANLGRPASGGRSYGSDSGGSYEAPRVDARTDGANTAGSFFSPEGQDSVPLEPAIAGNSGGGQSSSNDARSPSSTNTNSNGAYSGGIFGGIGSWLGGSGDGTSNGSGSGSGIGNGSGGGGGGPAPSPTPSAPAPTGISAGTTGGGAFVGETANHFKASVSIGVPLSGVSGTPTGGGGYRYQVNLSGQQAQ